MNYVKFFEPTGGRRANHIECLYIRFRLHHSTKEISIVAQADAPRYFGIPMGVNYLQGNDMSFGYKVENSYAILDGGANDSQLPTAPFSFACQWGKFHVDESGELTHHQDPEVVFVPQMQLWDASAGYQYANIWFRDKFGTTRNLCYTHMDKPHTGFRFDLGERKGNHVLADIQPSDLSAPGEAPLVCTPFIVRVDGWDGEICVYDGQTHIVLNAGTEAQDGEWVDEVLVKYDPVELLKEPGCVFDGAAGQGYNDKRTIQLATLHGWTGAADFIAGGFLENYPDNAYDMYGEDEQDQLQVFEVIEDFSSEAVEYLNEHAVAAPLYLTWHEGNLMLVHEDVELS